MQTTLLRHPAIQFALLLLVAAVLRWDTFGDPNMHGDEVFYQTVGVAMHHGALPYIDVWDRKPFGLFALSWLIAAFSYDMLAFQIAAALFATGTAWAITAMARCWTSLTGALLAGAAYLLWLPVLQGFGGQSPVFYNLFIALAALLVLRALPELREGRVPPAVYAAMLLAGYGITIKTSALFEAAFLGLLATWALCKSGTCTRQTFRTAALWAAIGAAPALLFAGAYAAMGHWGEYWHAMVTSNINKPPHWPTSLARLKFMALALAPIAPFALIGLLWLEAEARRFALLWLLAALLGLAAVPNFYLHYALPILVPLCIAASALFARGVLGIAAIGFLAFLSLTIAPFQPDHAAQSRAAIDRLETLVRENKGAGPLLLYDAPPQLYIRTGEPFPTPLVFPTHLAHEIEKDVSHLSTLAETQRVLALMPGAVVMARPLRNGPENRETHRLVLAYVGLHCRLIEIVPTLERQRTDQIAVWGACK
ncbi:MAG: hypothetical protein KUG65_02025 [Sphingomonadaceae bacterium]|nr:hypothetical protein [Sphingomonadaceae bacterium]